MCRRSCARARGSGAGAALGAGSCDGRDGVSPEPAAELARLRREALSHLTHTAL